MILEMHLKLRDQQLETLLYKYRLLYQNIMVTDNQKSAIDTHTKKKNTSTNKTLDIIVKITREENKRRKRIKDLQKQYKNN